MNIGAASTRIVKPIKTKPMIVSKIVKAAPRAKQISVIWIRFQRVKLIFSLKSIFVFSHLSKSFFVIIIVGL